MIVSISLVGFTEPDTWIISSFSKQRTTWTMASTSRILAKNWFPRPSPCAAPLTNPAISTNSIRVGRIFSDLESSAKISNLLSGTDTRPTLGSIVQKGKFAASALALATKALNNVDLLDLEIF